jgi:hypothetical protein
MIFPQQNSVALLPNDQHRFIGAPHLVNQGMEPLAGF